MSAAWIGGSDAVQRVLDETDGFGADYTFEATGLVEVTRQAVESVRMGYLITGRQVCGSSFGGVKGRDQVPQLILRALEGDIDVAPLVSHRITLAEVNQGFELMERQDGIRSVIEFSDP